MYFGYRSIAGSNCLAKCQERKVEVWCAALGDRVGSDRLAIMASEVKNKRGCVIVRSARWPSRLPGAGCDINRKVN